MVQINVNRYSQAKLPAAGGKSSAPGARRFLQFFNKNNTFLGLKRFLVVQNFSKALRIEFISYNLSSLDKGCCRFERFPSSTFQESFSRIKKSNVTVY